MDSDGHGRSSGTRSGARRGGRRSEPARVKGGSSATSLNYSSSEEDPPEPKTPDGRGFRSIPVKTGDRGGVTGRARVTPSDLVVTSTNLEISDAMKPNLRTRIRGQGSERAAAVVMPQHYYHPEVGEGDNHLNVYESPILKGGRGHLTGKTGHIGHIGGSSLSSSDNNSDTTYAESDINNSLRARMTAIDQDACGTPPDPAPPEVPPRGPSHHHPLLSLQGREMGGRLSPTSLQHYQEGLSDDGYQQPGGSVFLSQGLRSPRFRVKNGQLPERFLGTSADECEYLMSRTSPRYIGSLENKSPVTHPIFGPSPTRDFITDEFCQASRIMNALGSQKDLGVLGPSPGVSLGPPSMMNHLSLAPRSSFSHRKLQLGKSWSDRISWRCASIILLILCAILIVLLTFFIASYATVDLSSKNCVMVEDVAQVISSETQSDTGASTSIPLPALPLPANTQMVNKPQSETKSELTHLQVLNRVYSSVIVPQGYWNVQFVVKKPTFIRFNLVVPRNSQFAFYGRRNVAPSITQYDFVEFLRSGKISRVKRSFSPLDDGDHQKTKHTQIGSLHWLEENQNFMMAKSGKSLEDAKYTFENVLAVKEYFEGFLTPYHSKVEDIGRVKRYLTDMDVNITLVELLDTGIWYLSLYNDGLTLNKVSLLLQEEPEREYACVHDCSGHGSCILGHCQCVNGWIGEDCSRSACPILCSSHGRYGGGVCHCEKGWKGRECDVPEGECEYSDCHGHGTCVSGSCICHKGWKGENCNLANCEDPTCGGSGWCVEGICVCRPGWKGKNCTEVDEKVFTCLPDCSGNGRYDLHSSSCVCSNFWSGPDCSIPRCNLDCIHGICDGNECSCEDGWTGTKCHERACDRRCDLHGKCHNGTCVCVQGWNGKHCTLAGCVNGCSGNGVCITKGGSYSCSCSKGWIGEDCSVALETHCNDEEDNDGDGLVDCNDSECCSTSVCRDHVMCIMSSDPVDVLLRKQPPAVTSSFYQKVKFIIEDRNVQSFARMDQFEERRVAVIRGQVVTYQGQGIVGVRTSVEKKSKFGLTATRKDGWFDLLVNGGGAVTLQFQRAHFEPMVVTVSVPWNQIVALGPVLMRHKDQPIVSKEAHKEPELVWSQPCLEHRHSVMKPRIISTFVPYSVGGLPESPVIFTENQVVQESLRIPGTELHLIYQSHSVSGYQSTILVQLTPAVVPSNLTTLHLKIVIEGVVFEKMFEADPNITYAFNWNKRNIYKQKVYGVTNALVSVGYEYSSCKTILWETQMAELNGYRMDISDIGGWNLDIHHMYNFESGLLQRGDGATSDFRDMDRLVSTLMGTGTQRTLVCKMCSGVAVEANLLTPSSLASGPDGAVYVGDFNLIRKVNRDGIVTTVLELSATQISHGYFMAISSADGHLYVSDAEKYRVVRLIAMDNVTDAINNFEVVAGNGDRCVPGDEWRCGDEGPALKARLSHPKGLAIATDGTMYIADGTNIRMVDSQRNIHTLIGHHGHKNVRRPLPCTGGIPANQVELQWATGLLLSPFDNSLLILDDHVVLQVTTDGTVLVKAGTPMHCKPTQEHSSLGTITSMALSPSGTLYLSEQTPNKDNYIKEIKPDGKVVLIGGGSPQDCGCASLNECSCPADKVTLLANFRFGPISALTVSPDGVIHVADQKALRIFSLKHYLPEEDENGDYWVAYPKANEIYTFNRHGQHTQTHDLTTGRKIFSFVYSKNTSFGRLTKVTDASGNKIIFLRDYKAAVSQIENSLGEKFSLQISRLGLMTKFLERSDRTYDFVYEEETGLLLSATKPGSLTTVYQYDDSGRLRTLISPTGFVTDLNSWMGGPEAEKYLVVGINEGSNHPEDQTEGQVTLAIRDKRSLTLTQGLMVRKMDAFPNGSWIETFPWGGQWRLSSITASNPLLEPILPIQARLLPFPSQYSFVLDPEGKPNELVTSFGVVSDQYLSERLVEKVILVNGSRVLSHKWKGSENSDTITDGERNPLLRITYTSYGSPENIILGDHFTNLNFSYDRFGRLERTQWERREDEYDYSSVGLLSSVGSVSAGKISYRFGENRLLRSVSLPSGRTWTFHYDEEGRLSTVETPSSAAHKFSLQPSLGFYVFSYTPPGASHSYRQHLDQEGRLLLTVYPTGLSKILHSYFGSGQLKSTVSGDGKTSYSYTDSGQVSEITQEEKDLEYRTNFIYRGCLAEEVRIDHEARTGLGNVKFMYEYDANLRLTSVRGRVGGQNLQDFSFGYDFASGALNQFGSFIVARPSVNETIVHDGIGIFSRLTNSHFLISQLSLTIHKMEVFRLDIEYSRDGKISQTNTYTRNFHSKPYTNTKNYTYDADGQLVSVEAKEPWSFSYDASGNMLSLTYSTNTIPMKYDSQDRIVKFGEGGYKYDSRGAIVQNVREVNYQYNARGMLIRASRVGRFNIKYMYDHEGRLIARKDNFGNVTQFMYADQTHPEKVTHIYNPKDGNLISLVYDDRGHIIFAQMYRNKYYIATDQCGTPIMVFNQYGEVVREIMRSPFGHIIYDSNPYLYLPIDYCGGILEMQTELVHMPDGKVYDPLIGLLVSPSWKDIFSNLLKPAKLSLYRYNGNDPINVREKQWTNNELEDWVRKLSSHLGNMAPHLYSKMFHHPELVEDGIPHRWLVEGGLLPPNFSPFSSQIRGIGLRSGFFADHTKYSKYASRLATLTPSRLKKTFWPSDHQFEIAALPGPLGKGILVSLRGNRAIVTATPLANPIFRDVFVSVFNNSIFVDVFFTSLNVYAFYFAKEDAWRASEDIIQLNRLAGEVNISIHEQPSASSAENAEGNSEKVVDVKLHSPFCSVHIRYGTSLSQERKRLMKHIRKVAVRRAWAEERERLSQGGLGSVGWTAGEAEELLAEGSVAGYSSQYLTSPDTYRPLADDPANIRFFKSAKRSRRNLGRRWFSKCRRRSRFVSC